MIEIKLEDSQIQQALSRLKSQMTTGRRSVMAEIGEHLQESVKQRFERSEGPDGQKWEANSDSVIAGVLKQTKGNYKKRGGLTTRGQKRASSKKPLIGDTHQLKNVHKEVSADHVQIGSSRIQARVQQYGAKKGAFGQTKRNTPIPWGDIPARPYLGFSDDDKSVIMEILKSHLSD